MIEYPYPLIDNVALVDPTAVQTYLDMLFGYVEWGDRVLSLRGIGEKGTPKEGVFREPIWIHPTYQPIGAAVAHHAARWAQYHVATFLVPAALKHEAATSGEATENHIAEFTTIVADYDSGDTDAKLRYAEDRLGPATLVLYSGGTTEQGAPKYHAYWKFKEPFVETETVSEHSKIGQARHALALKTGADASFQRTPQVIRVAGSVHAKNGTPRTVAIVHSRPRIEYEAAELLDKIAELAPMPGLPIVVPAAQLRLPHATGDGVSFQPTPGSARASLGTVMTTPIHEGGTEDRNRWSSFNQVAGHYLHCVRRSELSLEEAADLCRGWMLSNMVPAWPESRFRTEFTALFHEDISNHGPMPVAVPRQGDLPATTAHTGPTIIDNETGQVIERARGTAAVAIRTVGDLTAWAAHRWTMTEPPPRRFLVRGLIVAGTPHLLVAEGGAGKTFVVLDLALKLAAYQQGGPSLAWMGEPVMPPASGGTVVMLTAEDDQVELHNRLHDIDPHGLRGQAGDRLIVLPLINAGGAFPIVAAGRGDPGPSGKWAALFAALREIAMQPGGLSAVVVDTLNATLHGDENAPNVIAEYFREVGQVCGDLGAALVVTHHTRKAGKEPVRYLEDMKEAVRGSSALGGAVRAVLGIWHATDYFRRMTGMGMKPERGVCYRMGVVKANNPEMMKSVKTLLRQPSGLLIDATASDKLSDGPGVEHMAWLAKAIETAAGARHPFTKTGANGVWARRSALPPPLHSLMQKELEGLVARLMQTNAIVLGVIKSAGKSHQYLDVPDGMVARGQGVIEEGSWKAPDWAKHVYDAELDAIYLASD